MKQDINARREICRAYNPNVWYLLMYLICLLVVIWEFVEELLHTANLLPQKLHMERSTKLSKLIRTQKIFHISSMHWSRTIIKHLNQLRNTATKIKHYSKGIPSPLWWPALQVQSGSDTLRIVQHPQQCPLSQSQTHGILLSMDQLPDVHLWLFLQ